MKSDNYFKVAVWSDVPVPPFGMFADAEVRAFRKPVRRVRRHTTDEIVDQRRAYSWTFPFKSSDEGGAEDAYSTAHNCRAVLLALGLEARISVFSPNHRGTFSAPTIGESIEEEQGQGHDQEAS
jgi:hypothetical protein